ncbi:MAG: hypothetical protein H6Q38_1010, partial [Chloroflexi bacterium]|nr:hypothetical protein [Chloroflexota bacterium]
MDEPQPDEPTDSCSCFKTPWDYLQSYQELG